MAKSVWKYIGRNNTVYMEGLLMTVEVKGKLDEEEAFPPQKERASQPFWKEQQATNGGISNHLRHTQELHHLCTTSKYL